MDISINSTVNNFFQYPTIKIDCYICIFLQVIAMKYKKLYFNYVL
jgi:hypothetical protein